MYEEVTYDVILERMLERVSNELDKRESSLIYDTQSATAIELQILYIELDTLIKNSYGDTAAREFLILLCKDRGITPEEATNAVLLGKFTPAGIDLTGQRFNIGEINYIVLELISEDSEASYYQVQCETPGIIGNQYLGNMTPIEYINGLQTASLTEVLIPGEDEEDTEVLRKRYFDSFKEQAFGGNRADYLEKVRKIDGVGNLKVSRVWNNDIRPSELLPSQAVMDWYQSVISGVDEKVALWLSKVYVAACNKKLTVGGTVLLTVVNSLDFGEASSVLLDTIQTAIDPVQNAGEGYGLAPIGHVVQVNSAEPVPVYVSTVLTFEEGYSWSNLETSIREVIEAYLLELRKEWADHTYTVIRISQIETRILGIKGVVDIEDTKINDGASNLTLTEFQIPVLGGVSG